MQLGFCESHQTFCQKLLLFLNIDLKLNSPRQSTVLATKTNKQTKKIGFKSGGCTYEPCKLIIYSLSLHSSICQIVTDKYLKRYSIGKIVNESVMVSRGDRW